MKGYLFSSLVTCIMFLNQATAGTMGLYPKPCAWISSISIGSVWASAGETQTFYLTPEIEKTYYANKSSSALPAGELFIGIQKLLNPQWLGQFGLSIAATGNAKLQGVMWDDADPQFDNYLYQYKIRNTHLGVKGKLLLDRNYWAMPWVGASFGVGFNRAHNFINTPVIFEAVPNDNFTNNTKTSFTYTLSAGIQKYIDNHWQVGLGYEFADWGKSALSRAAGQTLNSGLALNHLYTNGVMLSLTYAV